MAHQRQPDRGVARRGLMLVLSSPSGAGKTTLSRKLLDEDKGVTLSVSVTTRKMRPGEKDGLDYHFIDRKRFDALIEKDELLEWAEVFDHCYGTPHAPVQAASEAGRTRGSAVSGSAGPPQSSRVRRPLSETPRRRLAVRNRSRTES